jgi:hypothetical protein
MNVRQNRTSSMVACRGASTWLGGEELTLALCVTSELRVCFGVRLFKPVRRGLCGGDESNEV